MSFFFKFNSNNYVNKRINVREVVPVHRLHKAHYYSEEYIIMMKKIIIAIDSRVEDLEVEVLKNDQNQPCVILKIKLIDEINELLNLRFNI